MTRRARVDRAWLCGVAVALLLLGCSSPSTPVDWKQLEASGRAVETPAGMDVMIGQGKFHWTDGTVPLEVVPIKSTFTRGMRLSTWVTGAQGNRTRPDPMACRRRSRIRPGGCSARWPRKGPRVRRATASNPLVP